MWPANSLGGPPKGVSQPPSLLEAFWENIPKGDFSKNIHKVIFTIHKDIFLRPINPKLFLCVQNNSSTHQNNFERMPKQFWNNVFSSEKATIAVPAAPEHFRFFLRKNPRSYQNDSGTLQEFPDVCRNHFDLMEYPETTFQFYRNYSDILSGTFPFRPKLFR